MTKDQDTTTKNIKIKLNVPYGVVIAGIGEISPADEIVCSIGEYEAKYLHTKLFKIIKEK